MNLFSLKDVAELAIDCMPTNDAQQERRANQASLLLIVVTIVGSVVWTFLP